MARCVALAGLRLVHRETFMTHPSRRALLGTAAAAGAVIGFDGSFGFITEAQAQKAAAKAVGGPPSAKLVEKGFHKFKVGDIEVTTVYDGAAPPAPIDPAFIPGRTADEIKAALIKGGHSGADRPNYFTVTVIKTKGKTVMFDSSTGGQLVPTAGLMMARNMYKAGIDPQKISTIIVTHFHPDHISGMISKETNSKVFPDAEIVVPAAELAYWNDSTKLPDAQKALGARVQATLGKWKNVRQIKDGDEVMPGIKAVATHGHTPGHTSYLVASGKKQLMVLGDVTNIPAINVVNPDWSIGFDYDKPLAATVRRKIFDRAIADKIVMTGYHWGMPGAGTVVKDGNGYAYIPVKA
jgi:glyoxylase-like metal-dependent hydrolase (beta-lactamase superfamily II)